MTGTAPSPDPFGATDLAAYDADLNRGLALSGESKAFFAAGRLAILRRRLRRLGAAEPSRILDYGCGAGDTTELISRLWPAAFVAGVDPSESLIAHARKAYRAVERCAFHLPGELPGEERFDLVYCNGVFHHIPPPERPAALRWIRERLCPGGWFAFWENNGWNPATRWVMSRVAFDRDAVLISPAAGVGLLRQEGFRVLSREFAFIFPKSLGFLRPWERVLARLPLGTQYQVLGRRDPAETERR